MCVHAYVHNREAKLTHPHHKETESGIVVSFNNYVKSYVSQRGRIMVETQFFSLGKHGLYTENINDREERQ